MWGNWGTYDFLFILLQSYKLTILLKKNSVFREIMVNQGGGGAVAVAQIPTSFGHELRACLRCRLVKTYDQVGLTSECNCSFYSFCWLIAINEICSLGNLDVRTAPSFRWKTTMKELLTAQPPISQGSYSSSLPQNKTFIQNYNQPTTTILILTGVMPTG